ncbi:MAG: serine hydrolase [Acidobacteria bacterium]|jgi:CubicO group peptidase (beta-lactamase class C family)|nr:serine hydrolase [Acidobacteriota bacterium]MDP7479439.1 serine hydrolase domain-containing protein [Vicinamibacterales bacterium]HJN43342.1 serine hydrolase domain-containing protein [Vicinamibacterales bacterium]
MTSLRTRPLVLLLTLAVLSAPVLSAEDLPRAQPEAVGLSGPRLERLTEAMQAYVDDGRLAGAVILVARRGRVAYLRSFGQRDIESRSPMADDAIFRIASQTKAIVSTGVMLLQEEGKLLISDPVGRYLPQFARTQVAVARDGAGYDVVDARGPITIRQLLTHTSGVSYGSGPASDRWESAGIQGWYFADREEPVGDTIARLAALPFDAHPGEQWIYGYNTDILGALIEAVSDQPLDEFIQTRILEPLGMEDTHFYLPLDKRDRLATVYSATNDGLDRAPNPGHMVGQGAYVDGPRTSFSGGAGLLSTATDYARFLQMTLNGGELEGTRLLGRKTVELMTTNHLTDQPFRAGQGFGLGFSIVEDVGARGLPGSKGEYGWGGAYHSTYWVDPTEELVVVYLTQLIPAGGLDDQGKIRALIYQAIED